ncbi:MAG TPA: hypothetical protein VGI46_17370 [Candidatus Acidoferrum sp.]|jgi:hypothetical protein
MLRGKLVVYAIFLGGLALVCTWAVPQKRTLIVAGHSGYLPVIEMGGRSYIEIEALARVTNGSLSFKGPQMVLTLPSAGLEAQVAVAAASQPVATGFTKEFLKASIEQMSVIREWRSTLTNAVKKGFPITEDWATGFSSRAQQNLRLVSVAASSESDRSALQLLTKEFNNMKALSDRFLEANRSRTYVPTNALDNDPLDQRILNCGHALAAMAANNQFVDDASCH